MGLTLFHGSRRAFECFDADAPARFDGAQSMLGVFLTDSFALASRYAHFETDDEAEGFDDVGDPVVYEVDAAVSNLKREPATPSGLSLIELMQLDCNEEEFASYRESVIAAGYDGVLFESDDVGHEIVVFDASLLAVTAVRAPDTVVTSHGDVAP